MVAGAGVAVLLAAHPAPATATPAGVEARIVGGARPNNRREVHGVVPSRYVSLGWWADCTPSHGDPQGVHPRAARRGDVLRAFGQCAAIGRWADSGMIIAAILRPKPLSMLTTVSPEAQELSIARSAAIPPNWNRSRWRSDRDHRDADQSCHHARQRPFHAGHGDEDPASDSAEDRRASDAGPPRLRRSPEHLSHHAAVSAASSATGRSTVPAVSRAIPARPGVSGSGRTVMQRAAGW